MRLRVHVLLKRPVTDVTLVVVTVVAVVDPWPWLIPDETNRDQVQLPTQLIHLPIIIVATALGAWSSVVVVLVVVVPVKVLTIVVVGRWMILLQQWSDVVVIIRSEVSKDLLKLIQNVCLVSREKVLLVEVVVHKGLDGMLLPRSVPHFRIEIPIEIHCKLIIYSSLCCQIGEFFRFRNPGPI